MPSVPTHSRRAATLALCLLAGLFAAVFAPATTFKQAGFSESVVFSGLTNPAVVRFLPDGRVLVAEKSGLLKVFPNLTTNTYTIVGDLRVGVHNFWDRGLLGLAVPPGFDPASPDEWRRYVYVLYAHNAAIGGVAPRWPTSADGFSDTCPGPPAGPGATTDGCLVSGRLSRLPANGNNWTEPGEEEVLLEDWCQQYPSHSTGAVDFGLDEKLYVSGGDGASFNAADWGQFGGTVPVQGSPGTFYTPANPCADPPFPLGTPQTKPTARGGALRSQTPRRPPGEARLLNGAILRVDPATGDPLPDNPLFSSSDPNEQRMIAYGLRNPFRMIVRPGTNEVIVADVGWGTWEELNRIPDLSVARNFGWPCFEGNGTQYTGLDICPAQAQTTAPFLTYNHSLSLVPGDGCSTGSSSIAGMAFYQGASNYPPSYENALFFSDYSRKCMWVMFADGSGNPNPASTAAFANTVSSGPVDLQIGPDGNLYYVDFNGGRIMRIKYGLNAAASASPLSGDAPLLVAFDGSATAPAQAGDTLTYDWDLDGDGEYDDSSEVSPSHTYTTPGNFTVRLQVTDQRGATDVSDPIAISAGNTAPTAVIDTPLASVTWKVNDTITFGGHGDDAQEEDGTVPEENLEWVVRIQHCPSDCHAHTYQTFSGVAGGSFPAPDHEYPAHLDIELTATDTQGLSHTTTVSIHPQTVSLQFQTVPPGLQLSVGTFTGTAPFTRTVIHGSDNALDALAPQGTFPSVWDFASWSDGGAEQHNVAASASASYTATYTTHADLSISASAAPEPVGAAADLTYTLGVANAGPSQATSISVTHNLPAGATLQSATGPGWVCSGSGPVTCTLASLGVASSTPISIVVTAPPDAGTIVASSSVSSATADATTANNSASTTSHVFARADLSVTQSGAPAAICTGQPITYTLQVSNAGPSTASDVSVTDTLPAGAALVSASGTGWSCSGTTTVTCTRPSLASGAAPAITVAITAPTSAGTAVNTAAVSSSTNDPASANNSSAASTTVNAIPAAPAAGNGGAVCAGDTLQLTAATVAGATYAWTGPNGFTSAAQNPTIPGATTAASGLYSVTVTVDACTSPAGTTTATVRALPTATVSGGGAICPGGSTTIQAALTGTGPWTVVWSDGVTQSNVAASPATRNVSPSATTTYTLTSVNDANCAGTDTGSATVTVRPRPTAAAGGTAEICAGASTPLSGSGGVSCTWAPATGLSNASSCAPTASPAATTTYTLTVTDANGCVSDNAPAVTVTVNPRPTASVSGTAAICAGSSTQIQAVLTGTGPWTLVWSDGVTQSNVAASPASRSVSPAATTVYGVSSISDAHCAGTASGSAVVTVTPRPTATVSGTAQVCAGGATTIQAVLTGTGPWTVVWSDGLTQSNVAASPATRSVSPAATTTYTVASINDANCSGTGAGSAVVTVNPGPTAAASGSAEICAGAPTPLSGSGGVSCMWAPASGLSNPASCTPTASPAGTTTYTLTVTDASGCPSTNAPTVTVVVDSRPTATVSGTAQICAGSSTQIQAALTGAGPWTVVWSDGFTQSNVGASPATRSVSPAATTTYTVASVSDANCSGSASGSAVVTVSTRPVAAAAGSAEICAGASTPLSGSGGVSCLWAPSAGLSDAASCAPTASPAATTTYVLTVTDASGCVSNNSPAVTVTVEPRPTAVVSGGAAICPAGSTTIQASLTGAGPWTVVWSDGFTQSNVAASPATRSVSPVATTTYTVTAVSDTNCAGTASGSAVVTLSPRPTAVASGTAEICEGGSTPLSGSGGVSCLWAPAAGLSDAASCSPTASPAATTTYVLTVTDASGCVSNNAAAVTVTTNPIPAPPSAGNGGAVCVGETLQLTASTVAGASYSWTGPNGFTSTLQNPTIPNATPAAAGVYSVAVTVAGCASSASTTSAVVRSLPTAFVTGAAAICAGDSAQVSAALTGTGPWNLTWSDGLAQSTGISPATRNVSPDVTTLYTVTAIADAHCAGSGSGGAEVTVGTPVAAPGITAPLTAAVDATGLAASVASHEGSTYAWTLSAGTITAGQGSSTITFDAAPPGTTMTLSVVETNSSCSSPAGTDNVQVDFLDVPPLHLFHDYVNTIARDGITAGCGGGNFCVGASNTREQMAVFLLKSKFGANHVPPPAVGLFSDVPAGSPFAPWVEEVAALQISVGCGGGKYCPSQPVTRGQMAVFLLKTVLGFDYVPPAATGTLFGDIAVGSFGAAWIEDLYNRGVTGGCQASPLLYCPSTPVTRGQMAVFLVRAFGL